jgi:DNA-binding transcriptional MocR family regulator
VARAHAGAGDAIAVEDTSYPGIFDIIENLRARPLALATDRAGIVPDALERALSDRHPKVLYVQAGPHNPTGRAPKVGRLRQLASILDRHTIRHDTIVIEDTALADLTFGGRVRPELANLCRHAVVATVGSFSKVAWGGLRIGWLRAPAPVIQRTMHLRLANDLGASVPAQLIALQLLPHLDDLAEHRRRTLAETMALAVERLHADFPTWQFTEPEGGSVIWAELPVDDSGPMVQVAQRHGVHIAPGSVARAGRARDAHIRICVDRPWPVVEIGLHRLQLAWRDVQRRARPVLG